MKKFLLIIFCIVGTIIAFFLSLFLLVAAGSSVYMMLHPDPVISSLPRPISQVSYCSDGFQDYTIYEKRCYSEDVFSCLEENPCLKKVEAADIPEIIGYVDDFEEWVKLTDYVSAYDFDVNCLSETDYFYIDSDSWEDEKWKYANYNVYIFDRESLTLYMIHNNI